MGNLSDGDFDSEVDSVSSKISGETDDGMLNMTDLNPIKTKTDQVDLSGFHDVIRKILAKPLPPNATTAILCRYKYASAAERVKLEKEKQKERRKIAKKEKDMGKYCPGQA